MGKILKQNYQNNTEETFLVQTRSQSKTKNAKIPKFMQQYKIFRETRKETKPIIIDDTPTTIDLDTKTGLDTQSQDVTVTKTPITQLGQELEVHHTQIQLQGHPQGLQI